MASCQNDPFVVKTTNGPVRGFEEEGTMAFKGIPYAKAERCLPPAPVAKMGYHSGLQGVGTSVSAGWPYPAGQR